jgi:molybdenum cofactor cytidylyltransferase
MLNPCPSPRSTLKTPTAGILLAAGESTRFGEPKQLLTLSGRFLIEWALAAALGSNLDHVVLVLGCEHERIRRCLGSSTAHPKCEILVNPDYSSGQSTSLQAGLLRIRHDFPSTMFRYAVSEKPICVPTHRGTRGNPTLFASRFYPEILKLAGDKGARDIIAAHPDQVLAVKIPDPRVFLDIDRREDIEKIAALLESRQPLRKTPGT